MLAAGAGTVTRRLPQAIGKIRRFARHMRPIDARHPARMGPQESQPAQMACHTRKGPASLPAPLAPVPSGERFRFPQKAFPFAWRFHGPLLIAPTTLGLPCGCPRRVGRPAICRHLHCFRNVSDGHRANPVSTVHDMVWRTAPAVCHYGSRGTSLAGFPALERLSQPCLRFEIFHCFPAVRLDCSGRFHPVDTWKLRLLPESCKQKAHELSTACRIRGGQAWITPSYRIFPGCSAAQRWSRWASRRSRRALSLMKPAASFWS